MSQNDLVSSKWRLPPRICYALHHSYPHSADGYAVRSHGIASGLVEQGLSVVACVRPGHPWDLELTARPSRSTHEQDHVRYVFSRLPTSRGVSLANWQRAAADAYERLFRIFKPNAVLAASNWESAQPATEAADRIGLSFYYEVRGFWEISRAAREPEFEKSDEYKLAVEKDTEVAERARRVFTLNRFMRDELIRRGVDSDKIDIVPNAFALPIVECGQGGSVAAEASEREWTVGYIGSFSPYEGLEDLLQACATVRQRGVDVRLLLVGSSGASGVVGGSESCPVTTRLRALAERLGIASFVRFAGRVPNEAIARFYGELDLFVIPRKPLLVCELVSPIKPLEAAAYGVPMLCSDVAPLAELQESAGLALFHKGSADDLAVQMERLLADPERRQRMSLQARAWVTESRRFSHVVSPMLRAFGMEHKAPPRQQDDSTSH